MGDQERTHHEAEPCCHASDPEFVFIPKKRQILSQGRKKPTNHKYWVLNLAAAIAARSIIENPKKGHKNHREKNNTCDSCELTEKDGHQRRSSRKHGME